MIETLFDLTGTLHQTIIYEPKPGQYVVACRCRWDVDWFDSYHQAAEVAKRHPYKQWERFEDMTYIPYDTDEHDNYDVPDDYMDTFGYEEVDDRLYGQSTWPEHVYDTYEEFLMGRGGGKD